MKRLVTTSMLWRSVAASFIVGGLLFTINHDRSELVHQWTWPMWKQLGISMAIPFVVSLVAAILARREMLAAGAVGTGQGRDQSSQR